MTLYVVATPIGNLEDITLRALRVLREVGLIATEDTRKTRKLLNAHEIKTPLTSFHEFSDERKVQELVSVMHQKDVALVTEAGVPGISDPGYDLVKAAIKNDISVVPIPGPSAVVTALSAAGLPADQFVFAGFLPRKGTDRRKLFADLAMEKRTIVAYEAPHRVEESLRDMLDIWGNRQVAVCRELTKIHEEIWRGSTDQAIVRFKAPLGEFTLVIEGFRGQAPTPVEDDLISRLRALAQSGLSGKEAVAQVARDSGVPRRQVYRLWLETHGR